MSKSSSRKPRKAPRPVDPGEPPYLRIASEIRRRIESGELGPAERVPSTRQIARQWGVAMATATKALSTLQHEGWIRAEPRVGAIVARRPAASRASRAPAPPASSSSTAPRAPSSSSAELTRERIARAAIAIADAEGLTALSMRGVAAKLEVPTMTLYRHVPSKEDLVLLMTDTAFGDQELPQERPAGWRARLELAARLQWALYRRHPWLAQGVTLTRPLPLPNVMAYAEWSLSAIDGLGLDGETMLDVHMTVFNLVRGVAINLDAEMQAEAETGLTEEEWVGSRLAQFDALAASGKYPTFARVLRELSAGYDLNLDKVLEMGLMPMLDGLAGVIERRKTR